MQSLTLNVSDQNYEDVLKFLKSYPKEEISIIDKCNVPDFVVQSVDEAKKRVHHAEQNGKYISHEVLCKEMDAFIESL